MPINWNKCLNAKSVRNQRLKFQKSGKGEGKKYVYDKSCHHVYLLNFAKFEGPVPADFAWFFVVVLQLQ